MERPDLIVRLRSMSESGFNPIGNEAADYIEELQTLIKLLEDQCKYLGDNFVYIGE